MQGAPWTYRHTPTPPPRAEQLLLMERKASARPSDAEAEALRLFERAVLNLDAIKRELQGAEAAVRKAEYTGKVRRLERALYERSTTVPRLRTAELDYERAMTHLLRVVRSGGRRG